MELNDFKTDPQKENDGTWVELGPTSRIKLARIGNAAYRAFIEKRTRPYQKLIRAGGEIPMSTMEKILDDALATLIVRDWEGITEGGAVLPFNEENVRRALAESRDFRDFVVEQARAIENFHREAVEAGIKNSVSVSVGN